MDLKKFVECLENEEMNELSSLIHARRAKLYRALAKPLSYDEKEYVKHFHKVEAIKMYRERVGCSLYEAKCAIDVYEENERLINVTKLIELPREVKMSKE